MRTLLILVGTGQIVLVIGSLWLPRVLRWPQQLSRLEPLTRRIFWVYAGYILATNLCLGSLSVAAPELLLTRTPLARLVAGYAAGYWGVRLILQFVWFRKAAPKGLGYALADGAVTIGFAACTMVYGALALDRW
ncbi:MAG: hypothetical protein IPK26_03235 [Planctomycetes bacterium]|nr:hypothetical protein [Planctomycetota bacterium]